jgi:hypothetical protein
LSLTAFSMMHHLGKTGWTQQTLVNKYTDNNYSLAIVTSKCPTALNVQQYMGSFIFVKVFGAEKHASPSGGTRF